MSNESATPKSRPTSVGPASPARASSASASASADAATWPDFGRTDIGMLLTSRWRVTDANAPREAAERAALAWSRSSTPAGLVASHVFISADDRKLVRISQWRDDDDAHGGTGAPSSGAARPAIAPSSRTPPRRGRAIVPVAEASVEHLGTRLYRPYRSGSFRRPDEDPGALFVIDLDLGAPGRAQDWVELIFAAIAVDGRPAGLLAGHFYVSDDGRRAVNLAEWVSEDAHREAVGPDGGFMVASPAWRPVRDFGGGRTTVESYRFLRSTAHVA